MAEQPSGEKTEDATPKRRADARKKGTVAKSVDLVGAISMMVIAFLVPGAIQGLGVGIIQVMKASVTRIPTDVSPASLMTYGTSVAGPLVTAVIPLLLTIMVIGVAINFGQVGFMLSAEPMKPTFEKINPAQGLKRMFSRKAFVDGLKAIAKLGIFSYIVYSAVKNDWTKIVNLATMDTLTASMNLGNILHGILVKIAMVWLVIAAADYFFQRKEVEKQIKMTKDELRREMKEQEGSPELKMAISQRRRKILQGGMAAKLKEATVLVTNPTHFAIAIKYERNSMHAPIVIAKGQDLLALRMKEMARDLELPIIENKPLARALHKQCEAGDFVPRDLFTAVAEVLAFVYKTSEKSRSKAS